MKKKTKPAKLPDLNSKIKQITQYIERGQWHDADELATKLLVSYPNNLDVLLPASEIKFSLSHHEEALKLISRAIKTSHTPDHFIRLAIDKLQDNKPKEAEHIANDIVGKYHRCQTAFDILGISLKRQGRYNEAVSAFKNAIALEGKSLFSWINMGNTYFLWKKYEDALTCFDEAILINPTYAEAIRLKASVYIRLGRNEQACQLLLKALGLAPDNTIIMHDLTAAYYNSTNYHEALRYIYKALKAEPKNATFVQLYQLIAAKVEQSFTMN